MPSSGAGTILYALFFRILTAVLLIAPSNNLKVLTAIIIKK